MSSEFEAEYESYDQIESELENKPTGWISALCPNRLYRLVFGSIPPKPELVDTHRERIQQQYDELLEEFQSVRGILPGSDDASLEDVSRDYDDEITSKIISTIRKELGDTNKDSTEISSLRTRSSELEQKLDRCSTIIDESEALLTPESRPLLRETEQRRLETIQRFLEIYVRAIETSQRRIQATIRIHQRRNKWQRQLETLEERLEPYLNYDRYEVEDGLAERLEELYLEIQQLQQQTDSELLSDELSEELQTIQNRLIELWGHLDTYQTDICRRDFRAATREVHQTIAQLRDQLYPAKLGQPLDEEAVVRKAIGNLREELADLRDSSYNSAHRDKLLDMLAAHLDEIESYIDAKAAFDSRIPTVESKITALSEGAAPYLNYEEYLTRPARNEIHAKKQAASKAIDTLRQAADVDQLTPLDQQRIGAATRRISEIECCLDGYNEEFVERERERCSDLFHDIGPNSLDLTPEQQRAVVRNDVYNKVIAAAGTGKTLVLTTRVAYLVQRQGVEPSQILVVAFTREARDEMQERLASYFGIIGVQVETLHAFGYSIIQSDGRGPVDPIGQQQILNVVDRKIRAARDGADDRFLSHFYEFLVHFDDVYLSEADFESKEEYVQARAKQRYQTLKGEEVRSRAEKLIADFLFTHQVDYRYEDLATWADTAVDKGSYEPDFYLPEYDIYLEHWGIDESGTVAPWFSWTSEQYHEKLHWAREQFAEHDQHLIETYEFEHEADLLESVLRHRLQHNGVDLDRMEFEELIETAFDYDQREGWIKRRFRDFIQNAKRFDVKPAAIESKIESTNKRQYHFAHCGIILLQYYQKFLVANDLIDFTDMITQSLELIRDDPATFTDRYDHILVDEFQDIGIGQLELLQELTGPDAARLFAVGDDWQSIYSFQGAVVQYFINFDDHFGPPARTILTKNFRSPSRVIAAGNALIDQNDDQIQKDVVATVDHDTSLLVHALTGYTFHDYVYRVAQYAKQLLDKYLAQGSSPGDIMILCRFDDAVPYLDEIKNELRNDGIPFEGRSDTYRGQNGQAEEFVSVYSVYQAKGREADHVILVHAAEGPYGFPPADREDELLQPVKTVDTNTLAEERRAFYVAITRTRRTLDILTRDGQISRFIEEIDNLTTYVDQSESIEPLDDVGSQMSVIARVKRLYDDVHPKKHQDGILVDQFGGSARFVSWENTDPPTLEADTWYRFDGVRVSEFNESKELVVTARSSITELDDPDIPSSESAPR